MLTSRAILIALSPLAPDIGDFAALPRSTRITAADGSVLAELDGSRKHRPVDLESLPDHVSRAVLAAEDSRFYQHSGVDPSAIFRALIRTVGGDSQGGSTITQQLAKLNYTGSKRTLFRKFREVQYATRLEEKYTKDELLERYLNQVYFGDGAYGIAAAAQTFFGVEPDRLTVGQAAALAGKIRAPEALDPRTNGARLQARRDHVLARMLDRGWITETAHAAAAAEPIEVSAAAAAPSNQARAPHFVEYVKREAATIDALGGAPESRGKQLFTGGYTIETTLDPGAQEAAAQAVRSILPGTTDPEAAVVSVVPGDGAIRALYGGRDFAARQFDLASQGGRQPGSSFKPFVYLAAIRDGIDPRSTFDASSPKQLEYRGEQYVVDNYEGEGQGRSIDDALVHSINTVYAQLVLELGPANVTRVAERLGIDDADDRIGARPAIALGGVRRGITPLQHAAAFAALAAKGRYAEPYSIVSIKDSGGDTIFTRRPEVSEVFDEREVGVLNAALIRVVREGTGRAASIGRPVAGKTGTTQEWGDAWFVGFVPQLATAVWVGHPDGIIPMTNVHGRVVTGGSFPAQIFAAYMRRAVERIPIRPISTADPRSLSLRMIEPAPPPPPPGATVPPLGSTTTSAPASTTTTSSTSSSTTSSTSTTSTTEGRRTTTTTEPSTTTTTSSSSTTTTTQPP